LVVESLTTLGPHHSLFLCRIDRKNAALARQRTKAQIEDLHSQLNESANQNVMLTKLNAELVSQVNLLTRENLLLRQSLALSNQQGSLPLLSAYPTSALSLDAASRATGSIPLAGSSNLLGLGSQLTNSLGARLLPSSSILAPSHHESQTQLLQALLLQQECDQTNLARDHRADG
jgi:hypothetical protein